MQSSQHQKSDETKEYTIEVLVAVDKKMQEYHGKSLKNYVLTLMSVVSWQVLEPFFWQVFAKNGGNLSKTWDETWFWNKILKAEFWKQI